MSEEMLLTGHWSRPMNDTQSPRSQRLNCATPIADSIGDDFISVMPTNLYGPNDNYHPLNSHVSAALIRTFSRSKIRHGARKSQCGKAASRAANSWRPMMRLMPVFS
jgi:GDP-L-fucose synthase